MTAGTGDIEMLRAESSLPSIEELTKNVQSLIDKDNGVFHVNFFNFNFFLVECQTSGLGRLRQQSFKTKGQKVPKSDSQRQFFFPVDPCPQNSNIKQSTLIYFAKFSAKTAKFLQKNSSNIEKFIYRYTPDMIRSGYFRNNNSISKKVDSRSKNFTIEQKCKNKVYTGFHSFCRIF